MMDKQKLFKILLHSIFPCKCPYCDKAIKYGSYACGACKSRLKQENIISNLTNCVNVSPFRFDGMYKSAVYSLKFHSRPGYAEQMAIPMTDALKSAFGNSLSEIDYITYVPASKKREQERGYNQALLLAKHISFQLGICCKPLLLKVRENKVQHLLPRNERKNNVKNAFAHNNQFDICGKNILLVDDIFTTGATIGECAKVLLKASASSVFAATFVTVTAKNIESSYDC